MSAEKYPPNGHSNQQPYSGPRGRRKATAGESPGLKTEQPWLLRTSLRERKKHLCAKLSNSR
jgi:hypothetical protein